MNKRLFLIGIILVLFGNLNSQSLDSIRNTYNNNTLYRKGNLFIKGTDRLGFQELKSEFQYSPVGLDLYMKSARLRKWSSGLNIASLVTGLAAISYISKNQDKNAAYFMLGGQIVLGITSTQFRLRSMEYLDQAIWQRNRDVLFPTN